MWVVQFVHIHAPYFSHDSYNIVDIIITRVLFCTKNVICCFSLWHSCRCVHGFLQLPIADLRTYSCIIINVCATQVCGSIGSKTPTTIIP